MLGSAGRRELGWDPLGVPAEFGFFEVEQERNHSVGDDHADDS
jgi:hypothetical protein